MIFNKSTTGFSFSFIKFLRITILTAVLVLHQQLPARGTMVGGSDIGLNAEEGLHLMALSGAVSPELLRSFRERISSFLPYAKSQVVTLIDFSLPSTAKRLWTINLITGEVLFNTYVAHGQNSGDNVANVFSNKPESHQSSLGFYLTDEIYVGKHGNSMRLKGLEKNINDKAWDRAIVVHGADYATDDFIHKHGRLGRSFGCPAIPPEITDKFIETVKEGSLLFIYHPGYRKSKA